MYCRLTDVTVGFDAAFSRDCHPCPYLQVGYEALFEVEKRYIIEIKFVDGTLTIEYRRGPGDSTSD
jgi:hypothetical protein